MEAPASACCRAKAICSSLNLVNGGQIRGHQGGVISGQ
jgi:hypothetical protein